MSTPLYNAVQKYLAKGRSWLHTPGHGGQAGHTNKALALFAETVAYDVTELAGLDSLYEATGAIAESEARYARLYGAIATLFSAGGSTLCIQTMLALLAKPGATVVVNRGAHVSVIHALALLNMEPLWLYTPPDTVTGLPTPPTAEALAALLTSARAKTPEIAGVFITSPDYYGQNAAIHSLAVVAHQAGLPLLVDAAHGAHYPFVAAELSPLVLGADLVCHSLHKTLPALTGAALLHIGNPQYLAAAKRRMALFGSTSPSYLIMLSMDCLLPYLEQDAKAEYQVLVAKAAVLRAHAIQSGFLMPQGSGDPMRLTLGFGAFGYSQEEFYTRLAQYNIEPEYMDSYYCVLLLGAGLRPLDWQRLEQLVTGEVPQKKQVPPPIRSVSQGEAVVSLRGALFAPTERVTLEEALGRVCGDIVTPCPPGIPLLIPGEKVTAETLACCRDYGFSSINVLQW